MASVWPPENSNVHGLRIKHFLNQIPKYTSETVCEDFNFSLKLLSVHSKQLAYSPLTRAGVLDTSVPSCRNECNKVNIGEYQARNQGGENCLENFSPRLEKCVGHILKLVDMVSKFWAPLRKLIPPPSAPSWLRAW